MTLCTWRESSQSCIFNEPNITARNTVLIAFCSMLIAIPIIEFLIYLFKTYITPPAGQIQPDILSISTTEKVQDMSLSSSIKENAGVNPNPLKSISENTTAGEEKEQMPISDQELDNSFLKLKVLIDTSNDFVIPTEENEINEHENTDQSSRSCPRNIPFHVWEALSTSSLCQQELIRLNQFRQTIDNSRNFFQSTANKRRQEKNLGQKDNQTPYDENDDEEYGNGTISIENIKPQDVSSLAQTVSLSLNEFDRLWAFDESGQPTLHTAEKISKDMNQIIVFFFYAKQLSVEQQNTLLQEIHQVEGLSGMDKKILMQYWPIQEHLYSLPVSRQKKIIAWIAIIIFLIGLLIGLIFFGLRNGAKTNNTWILAFFVTVFFEVLINVPAKLVFQSSLLSYYFTNKLLNQNQRYFSASIKTVNQLTKKTVAQKVKIDRPGDLSFKIALRCGHLNASSTILENYIGRPSTVKTLISEDALQSPRRQFNLVDLPATPETVSLCIKWMVTFVVPFFLRLSCGYHELIISIFATSFITMVLFFFIGCYLTTPTLIILPFLVLLLVLALWFWVFGGKESYDNYFGRSAPYPYPQETQNIPPGSLSPTSPSAIRLHSPPLSNKSNPSSGIIQTNEFVLQHAQSFNKEVSPRLSNQRNANQVENIIVPGIITNEIDTNTSPPAGERFRKLNLTLQPNETT